jgi:hypothetical protein
VTSSEWVPGVVVASVMGMMMVADQLPPLLFGHKLRNAPTHAAARAGYDCDVTFQIVRHIPFSF